MIAQYTTVDTNVNVINDKEISLILSDSNICMILVMWIADSTLGLLTYFTTVSINEYRL